jgi:hypothetical protein
MFNILRQYHPMAGVDFHDEVTATLPPLPVPLVPHVVGHVLQGWGLTPTALMTSDKTKALGTKIMQRNTDIGNGIIHVPIPPYPPCALLILIIPFSGSKSYWGASTVLVEGKPVAAAILVVVNLNLNCGDPTAQPFNVVITWGNVVCGMTLGDIIGGAVAMLVDMAITGAFYAMGQGISGRIGSKIANEFFKGLVSGLLSQIVQQLTGSPLGYTWGPGQGLSSDWGSIGNLGPTIGGLVGRAIDGARGGQPPGQTPAVTPGVLSTPVRLPAGTPLPTSIANDPGVEEF